MIPHRRDHFRYGIPRARRGSRCPKLFFVYDDLLLVLVGIAVLNVGVVQHDILSTRPNFPPNNTPLNLRTYTGGFNCNFLCHPPSAKPSRTGRRRTAKTLNFMQGIRPLSFTPAILPPARRISMHLDSFQCLEHIPAWIRLTR